MDIIRIEQLEIFAYHGCNEEEKRDGQKFYVDAIVYRCNDTGTQR